MSERESSAPNKIVLADASRGPLGEQGGFTARFGITGARREDDGAPIQRVEDEVLLDARVIRVHDLGKANSDGSRDRRVAWQSIIDFDAEYSDDEPGQAPYGQAEEFTAENRSTRVVDGQGRVAIGPSVQRIVDSEDGRYGVSTTCNEIPLEGPASELHQPSAASGAPEVAADPPPGVAFREPSPGAQGLAALTGVSIGGVFVKGAAAVQAARAAIADGAAGDQITRAAIDGRYTPPPRPPAVAADAPPLPPTADRAAIPPAKRPGGMVSSLVDGQSHVGLLGTLVCPSAGETMHTGKEGTRIGVLPLRFDAQLATAKDRRGAFLIVDDDVADLPEPVGTLVKGWMAHDSSRAGENTSLPGETHKLRPVMRIDAGQIPPPPLPPPPYIDHEEPEDVEEEIHPPTPGNPAGGPVGPAGPVGPGGAPGGAGGGGGGPEEPARRFDVAVGDPLVLVGGTAGRLATAVGNPQAQGRDFTTPGAGVPCPLATGGALLVGEQARRGGTTGETPAALVVSRGHAAVVHTGNELLIGAGQGLVGADLERPATPEDVAAGSAGAWLQDRFVDAAGRPIDPRGFDLEADPRVPVRELAAAVPISAFPVNRQAIVRVRRANAEKREERKRLADASKISGVERRRVQNDQTEQRALRDLERRTQDARDRRTAAQGKTPPDQRAVDRANAELHRLGLAKSEAQDRATRQRNRLNVAQRRLESERRAKAQREARKREQQRRREERRGKPQGGMPVKVTDSPANQAAASATGWVGDKGPEQLAAEERARAASAQDMEQSAQIFAETEAANAAAALERAGLATTQPDSVIHTIPGLGAQIAAAGGFGSQNVLTTPFPIFGEAGGPASVAAAMQLLGAQMKALQAVVMGAFGGPGYLQSNVAIQHENTPGNPPAPSTLGAKWTAGPGEQLAVRQPAIELKSKLVAEDGGAVAADGDDVPGAVVITKETQGLAQDTRAGLAVTEKTSDGQPTGGPSIVAGTILEDGTFSFGWSVDPDGTMRHYNPDGTSWTSSLSEDGELDFESPSGAGLSVDPTTGAVTTRDSDGNETSVGGLDLDDLGDVDAPAPADGDTLTWDAGDAAWKAVAPTGGSGDGYLIGQPFRGGDSLASDWGRWGRVEVTTIIGGANTGGGIGEGAGPGTGVGASMSGGDGSYFGVIFPSTDPMGDLLAVGLFDFASPEPNGPGFADVGPDGLRIRVRTFDLTGVGELTFGVFVYDPADATTPNTDAGPPDYTSSIPGDAVGFYPVHGPFNATIVAVDTDWTTFEVDQADLAGIWGPGDTPAFMFVVWQTDYTGAGSPIVDLGTVQLDKTG